MAGHLKSFKIRTGMFISTEDNHYQKKFNPPFTCNPIWPPLPCANRIKRVCGNRRKTIANNATQKCVFSPVAFPIKEMNVPRDERERQRERDEEGGRKR